MDRAPFLRPSWWGAITLVALAAGLLLEALGVYQPAHGHEGHGGTDTFLWRALLAAPLLVAMLLIPVVVRAALFIGSGFALLLLGGLTQAVGIIALVPATLAIVAHQEAKRTVAVDVDGRELP